jgi:LuxR family transcriptional regulator, maltose regulon positive regulatory protein
MPFVPNTKIAVPQLPPEFVARPALRADLDAADTGDVALVCAPAGYGKTMLLADWARSSLAADVAWVGLDRDDNDPRRLWASVVASVAACPSVPSDSRMHAPWVWPPAAQPEFLAELGVALQRLPRPIRLVLDDVHELVDREALHGIQILMRNRPAGIQLVLASRLDPPLSLPRLRLAGRLWELRADQMRFSPAEAASLLELSGVQLEPGQVEVLHQRTGGWAAGLRLAGLAMARTADRDGFLADFSGDERSVANYLVEEIISRLPADIQQFLRLISISDPVPCSLAAELTGRQDAGSVLDGLEHQTSLVSASGRQRDAYRIQELLRTYLLAELHRHGPRQAADLHATAARWCADEGRPVHALDHAACSGDTELLSDLLHRFALPLILSGHHRALRRALSSLGAQATASDPWLALASALTHVGVGDLPAARADLRQARIARPSQQSPDLTAGLTVLRAVAEQFAALPHAEVASPVGTDAVELPTDPQLEALARLGRGSALLLDRDDRDGARANLEAAVALARRHGFDHLAMQCLVLLGVIAGSTGNLRTMRTISTEALAAVSNHSWGSSTWSAAATAMLSYTALLRREPREAELLSAEGLGLGQALVPAPVRFTLRMVHGAATFDCGDRLDGLSELQQARAEIGGFHLTVEHAASAAVLEFRAALLLGHAAAARTVQGWLAERADGIAELLLMRAWTATACGRHEHARAILRAVLEGSVPAVLPHSLVEAFLLEAALAEARGQRSVARRALQAALAAAEPLDAVRPFMQAEPSVRALLALQHGSFGATHAFAQRVLVACAGGVEQQTTLSQRELAVLGLLQSLLSLDEIAADLTVSVNTVKSHVRSIYTKLGVTSRRMAVLSAHERGLLEPSMRSG